MLEFDLRSMSPYFDSIRAADYVEETADCALLRAVREAFEEAGIEVAAPSRRK